MDKLAKLLAKLTAKERVALEALLVRLEAGDLYGLDVVKLKGHTDVYRARLGHLRVIFTQAEKKFHLLQIERRSEKTYRDF